MLANFFGVDSKGLYQSSGKEKESCCLVPSSIKREIRHFYVVVVQRRLRPVSNVVLLPCSAGSTVARQGLPCYTAVARLGFKTSRYCRAKVEFNSINWVRQGSSTTFETGLRNVQKNVMHVQSCCFANETYCFFWCTVTAKTSKTNGCFLLLRKTLLVHFVFCITYLGCLHPFETPRNYETNKNN